MDIGERIFSSLTTSTVITIITGNRIYPSIVPQGSTWPCVTYQMTNDERIMSLSGYTGLRHPTIQIDCYAANYTAAKDLATKTSTTLLNTTYFRAILTSEIDTVEHLNDETLLNRISITASCWYQE